MAFASSHREAPLISDDPLADNTDVYAFVSPDDPNSVTIIANYIPAELPHAGPNYYTFGENVRYEIHIDNNTETMGDDIVYRATFTRTNEDPTTFFNIRLGAQNIKATYTLERSMDGGETFEAIVTDGVVPPNNIGPRSITTSVAGLQTDYMTLMQDAITTASTGETVFCGPVDDPFFVDLGGVFDLGDLPRQDGEAVDGLAFLNTHTIALQIPISTLQKDGKGVGEAANILDGDFVIGVWASASRPQIRTLGAGGSMSFDGDWVQVSRLGMPLTNEAVVPIGAKDEWNARTPYNENPDHYEYFYNPELALYMDDDQFGTAVPAFSPLRVQRASLPGLTSALGLDPFDFGNGQDGLFVLKGNPALAGTALDDAIFGTLLLPKAAAPRSVDLWPIFHTGAPNFPPYQLATGKTGGNPLTAGKPFIHNFLPNGGDMLRLNMAVPATPRDSEDFSPLGVVQAAVLGLLDPRFNTSADLELIPNMDGFPNGRRLEDDVTRIELQAVSGIVLAAIGLWYDDFDGMDPVSEDLLDVYTYSTGVNENDATFQSSFPYMAMPWSGTGAGSGKEIIQEVECAVMIQQQVICPPEDNGTYTVEVWVDGGNGPYTIAGTFNGEVEGQELFILGPLADGTTYQIEVVDQDGCTDSFSSDVVACAKLPVELLSFEGEIQKEGNYLSWVTASEINNAYFTLERSLNGTDFEAITKVVGAGSTSAANSYDFMDRQAPVGTSYYRLKQSDFNGQSETFKTIALNRGERNINLTIDRVESVSANEVSVVYNYHSDKDVNISVYDAVGKLLYSDKVPSTRGKNSHQINFSAAYSGMYIVTITDGTEVASTKVLKQ
ncbi:MAG: DUF4331 family protein [Chitinophagales bacterium]